MGAGVFKRVRIIFLGTLFCAALGSAQGHIDQTAFMSSIIGSQLRLFSYAEKIRVFPRKMYERGGSAIRSIGLSFFKAGKDYILPELLLLGLFMYVHLVAHEHGHYFAAKLLDYRYQGDAVVNLNCYSDTCLYGDPLLSLGYLKIHAETLRAHTTLINTILSPIKNIIMLLAGGLSGYASSYAFFVLKIRNLFNQENMDSVKKITKAATIALMLCFCLQQFISNFMSGDDAIRLIKELFGAGIVCEKTSKLASLCQQGVHMGCSQLRALKARLVTEGLEAVQCNAMLAQSVIQVMEKSGEYLRYAGLLAIISSTLWGVRDTLKTWFGYR